MKWKYCVRDFDTRRDQEMEAIIGQWGAQGWELIAVVGQIETSYDPGWPATSTSGYRLFFKHPIKE